MVAAVYLSWPRDSPSPLLLMVSTRFSTLDSCVATSILSDCLLTLLLVVFLRKKTARLLGAPSPCSPGKLKKKEREERQTDLLLGESIVGGRFLFYRPTMGLTWSTAFDKKSATLPGDYEDSETFKTRPEKVDNLVDFYLDLASPFWSIKKAKKERGNWETQRRGEEINIPRR